MTNHTIVVIWFIKIFFNTVQPCILSISSTGGRGINSNYYDGEWLALETNQDHSVLFKVAPKYCISDSFVDYKGYSVSSMVLLPTVVDIMVSELNLPILVHFSLLILRMSTFLPSPAWPYPVFLYNTVLCCIRFYLHHQTHQLSIVSA